jgi:methoxymalonate biosynthesis acyl carrier protein
MRERTVEAIDARQVEDALREFIGRVTGVTDVPADADLFESGLVNSLFAVQLMTFVEKTFGIEVETGDLDMDNFRSLDATAALVLRKRNGGG